MGAEGVLHLRAAHAKGGGPRRLCGLPHLQDAHHLDPARRDEVLAAGRKVFEGRIDLYPSSPFFIEAVPLGVAKDRSLAALLERMGLTRENLMACGDGLNDRSMLAFAGTGVAMRNAEDAVKAVASDVTTADNNHDGVAEAIERYALGRA